MFGWNKRVDLENEDLERERLNQMTEKELLIEMIIELGVLAALYRDKLVPIGKTVGCDMHGIYAVVFYFSDVLRTKFLHFQRINY